MQNLTGTIINNRYRVDQFLGQGGMAAVYKVWDKNRASFLALKMLHEDLAEDRVFLRRFKREGETLAKLQHPSIVRFYGLEQDGLQAYMLMDFVEGVPLRREIFQLDGKQMTIDRLRKIVGQICSGLYFAHNLGMVHCDLKPGNVMINKFGDAVVMDFGIARLADAATATMVGMGTPAYMAPEQVKGLDPVPQTDIYALGVILYEMLTGGERPFTGDAATTTGTTSAKVRWEQVNLDPPSPRELNPKISRELEEVVLKCLAKDPADRFQTPLDLLKAIELIGVRGEPKESGNNQISPSVSLQDKKKLEPEILSLKTPISNWFQRYGGWIGAGSILLILVIVLSSRIMNIPFVSKPIETYPSTQTSGPTATLTNTLTPTLTPEPTATPIVYNVELDVVDEEGNSIPEAKIIQGETIEYIDKVGIWQKSLENSDLSINVWAQGYLLQEFSSELNPGDNKIQIQLFTDQSGLQMVDLTRDGYKLVFVEDFQDQISDCIINGNGNIEIDDTNPENQLLHVDLRNIDQGFACSFGPTNIEDAIIEADFRFVDIRYDDFKDGEYYNWQGYGIQFRDGFDVEGYPLQVEWGPTLQIMDFTEDEWKFPITVDKSIREAQWYTLFTKYDGNKVEVRMDGSLQFNYLNPPTMTNSEPAHISAFAQAHIQFDNIKMWIPSE